VKERVPGLITSGGRRQREKRNGFERNEHVWKKKVREGKPSLSKFQTKRNRGGKKNLTKHQVKKRWERKNQR